MVLERVVIRDARMPAFVVPEQVRNQVDELSSKTGLSRGEIMRRALSLFLDVAEHYRSSYEQKGANCMSIEARVLKSSNELEFEAELSEFLSTGWEVVSSHVVGTIEHTYCAILKRVPVTERMDLAALNEITR